MEFGGRSRRFSSGRSRMLESETILLEKRLEEMRTVMQVDRQQMKVAQDSKFIWQGGRSGKLRQFKYGKKKKTVQAPQSTNQPEARLKPHAPTSARAAASGRTLRDTTDLVSEKENIQDRQHTPPKPKVKKETHEISISTSPIPIEEEDLMDPHQQKEEESSGLWFPGAACVPKTPEKHEICIGTEEDSKNAKPLRKVPEWASTKSNRQSQGKEEESKHKPLVNSYFAKLYLQKSLHDSKKK